MTDSRDEAMLAAFARCVALLASTRTQMIVREGHHISDIDGNPPTVPRHNARCRSCKRPAHGRLLCEKCRADTAVLHGPPLIDVMYRSSHKKFEVAPGSDKEAVLIAIHAQKNLAVEALRLAEELFDWSQSVHRRMLQMRGEFNNTVYFTKKMVERGGAYRKAVVCGAPSLLHGPVKVGGLGTLLHSAVRQYVTEWLFALDASFRKEYNIPLNRDVGDQSLTTNLSSFATLITNRVVHMEEPADDDPTKRLCSLGCEHLANIQYLRCQYHAAGRVKRDVQSMRLLRKLAEKNAYSHVDEMARGVLLELLEEPPPELLKGMPTIFTDMHFGELRDAIGLLPSEGSDATAAAVSEWRASINAEFLCMRLDAAIVSANTWRRGFLNCLQPAKQGGGGARLMPTMAWVGSGPLVRAWHIVPMMIHGQRRTGLDPTGLRIVLVSAAIMQLLACESPTFFAPGEVRCELVQMASHKSMEESLHAIEALRDQMRPLAIGVEWMHARRQMQTWQNSHIDAHVHRAFAQLGGFSFQELSERFLSEIETVCEECGGRGALHWGCRNPRCGSVHVTTQRTISERVVSTLRPRVTELMLPLRPNADYDSWLALTVKVAMPMLYHARQSLGFGTSIRTNPAGEWLRAFAALRGWKPSDGPISLTAGQVYHVPQVKQLLLQSAARGDTLAKKKRVKSTEGDRWEWHFNSERLLAVLGSV
jgi:hypothetical protein